MRLAVLRTKVIGSDKLNKRLARLAQGQDVTPALLRASEKGIQRYVERVNATSPGSTPGVRWRPKRHVMVSPPGEAPNTDTAELVNSTGVHSEGRNNAEFYAGAEHARHLEFGTERMAPRPAMKPAFDENRQTAIKEVVEELRKRLRG